MQSRTGLALHVQAGGVPPQLPSPQSCRHAPQFVSLERLTQGWPYPHDASPGGHWHPEGVQEAPAGHRTPQ